MKDNFAVNPVFQQMYIQAGGLEKTLTNAELADVLERYKNFEEANYQALQTSIAYTFKGAQYEPEILSMLTPLKLTPNNLEYQFDSYQVLQYTMLVDFCLPVANSFTKTPLNENVLPFEALCQGFLTLNNDRQQTIVKQEPLLNFIRDTSFWEGKGKFKQSRIDWMTSKIEFPNNTVPTTYEGYVILPVVHYIDMKRYPYLKTT